MQKNGAGAHAWGALADEYDHEFTAQVLDTDSDADTAAPASKPIPVRRASGEPNDDDRESARQLRAKKDRACAFCVRGALTSTRAQLIWGPSRARARPSARARPRAPPSSSRPMYVPGPSRVT